MNDHPASEGGAARRSLSSAEWIALAGSACVIAALSLGVHDMMLTRLGVPYPNVDAVPVWARFVDTAVRVAGLVWLCRIARPVLHRMSTPGGAALVGAMIVLLNENLRVLAVSTYLTHGWLASRWLFTLLDRLPSAGTAFFHGAAATVIARYYGWGRKTVLTVAVLLVTVIATFALQPSLRALASATERALGLTEPAELYALPYPAHVYAVIYSTFIEPTIAAFVLAALVWTNLTGSSARRVLIFVVLILLVRGRIVTELLFSFWVPLPLGLAFLSEGQFFLETFVLALLTGAAWASVERRRSL